ncbi:hypothetical protein TKK_0006657 [Trichogramma kaykai]|uniref:C2H2-type domain-containing protein n=1 Tax=Trichogramma kaykai TaxID=54128 RepID=A0ABD2XCZ2_9HYME
MAPAIKFVLASSLDCGKRIVRTPYERSPSERDKEPGSDRFICSVERPIRSPSAVSIASDPNDRVAIGGRLYRCMRCDCASYFATFPDFKFHLALAHPSLRLKYVCRVCGKGFATANVRNKHRKIQHDGAKAIDDGNYEDEKEGVVDDARLLAAARRHVCDKCQRSFRDPDNLKRHVATVHRAEGSCARPHKCDQCDKAYSRKDHLKEHRATSHDSSEKSAALQQQQQQQQQKPKHTCASCGKGFQRKDSFRYHERHKPCALVVNKLACDRCGREFRRRCDLTRHCATCAERDRHGSSSSSSSSIVEMDEDV